MSHIKPIRYRLYITNDDVDVGSSDAVEISYNGKTKIKHDSKDMYLSLFGLSFKRKVYEPGQIEAEVQVTIDSGAEMPTIAELRTIFLRKKVQLTLSVGDDSYDLATNYYIQEISPLIEKSGTSTSIYLKLNIYSLDNLMRLDKFSEVYLARQLRGEIVTDGVKDYVLKAGNSSYGIDVSGSGDKGDALQHLVYEGEEFTQPYLVQYNECFYDFVTRVANRCGEFVFFEDGKLHVGLDKATVDNAGKQAPIIDNYTRLTYQYIGDGVVDVQDYTHDSMKQEDPDPQKALDSEPKTDQYSKANIMYVKETGLYPDVSGEGVPKKIYNNEYAAEEFFIPLYRNQFSKGLFMEYLMANGGSLFVNFLGSLGKPTLLDIIVDNVIFFSTTFAKAAIYGDKANEVGNKAIDEWVGKDGSKAVPFADIERRMWTTIRYYHDIKSNEERQQRQMVCVDMGPEVLVGKTVSDKTSNQPLKIGDVVKIDGDNRMFLVVGIEMHSDQPWQRCYEGYGSASVPAGGSRLKFHAIPMADDTKFYPPVSTTGAFRQSNAQHAVVIDSDDPKLQGRVRIRYPWQSAYKEKKKKINDEIDNLKKDLDSKSDEEKKQIGKKILDKGIEALQVEAATPWIRMTTPMATRGGGVLFKPEPGDEVLVEFENGNIERPYVVGALYSKNTPAPDSLNPQAQYRIIRSPNGHSIMMEDPTDLSKFLGGMFPGLELLKTLGLMDKLKIDVSSKEEDSMTKDLVLGMTRNLLGGITLTDSFGFYKIAMSTHKRRVEIASSLGDVTIDALTGISINSPKGDVKITGKNVTIEAGNRLTLKSGGNIPGPKVEINAVSVAKTVADQINKELGSLIDMSFIRSIMEIILAPVNGTMQIKSCSFLVLEAGTGTAEIPATAYQERYLAEKNLSRNSSGYQALQYILATLSSNIDECPKKIAELYNKAAEKVSALHKQFPTAAAGVTEDRDYFHGGGDLITSLDKDQFVKKCLGEPRFWQLTLNSKLGLTWSAESKSVKKQIEEAYAAIHALKEYCDQTVDMFKHFANSKSYAVTKKLDEKFVAKFESSSVYKLLDQKFTAAREHAAVNGIDWVKKIKEFNTSDNAINFAYFVGENFTAKHIDASTHDDYTNGLKKFKRCFCYHVLGTGNNSPVNDVSFLSKRNFSISSINAAGKSDNDIINDTERAWSEYANSIVLADNSADAGFLGTLAKELTKMVDDKMLTYSPERSVWRADVKGQILMSDSTDTVSLTHPEGGGVGLKASGNTQFDKKTLDDARKYISRLLVEIGG